MSDAAVHRASLRIPASHPALPGHFPGRPIVPAVVLLQCVLDQAELWLGRTLSVRALPQAKFPAPLLPEQSAEIELRMAGEELRFTVARATQVVSQGSFKVGRAA